MFVNGIERPDPKQNAESRKYSNYSGTIHLQKSATLKNLVISGRIFVVDITNYTNSMELSTTQEIPSWTLDNFPECYGTRRFNTEFTRAPNLSLS
jgi:hypothetical protein